MEKHVPGNKDKNLIAFKREGDDGVSLEFTAVQDNLSVIMKESEGTMYDVSGLAVGGQGEGEPLRTLTLFMGY